VRSAFIPSVGLFSTTRLRTEQRLAQGIHRSCENCRFASASSYSAHQSIRRLSSFMQISSSLAWGRVKTRCLLSRLGWSAFRRARGPQWVGSDDLCPVAGCQSRRRCASQRTSAQFDGGIAPVTRRWQICETVETKMALWLGQPC